MINKISVKPDTYSASVLFFDEIDLTKLKDRRMVLLFGPNGAGKTTLLKGIHKSTGKKGGELVLDLDERVCELYTYMNGVDNFRSREARTYSEAFDPLFVKSRFDAQSVSEGQSIIYSVLDLVDGMMPGKFCDDDHDMVVLLDEIDSGLSIDNIDTIMRKIKRALSKRQNLQVFLSFNSPRVLRHFSEAISMYDGNPVVLHNEDDMMSEIRKHKKEFDKVRKKRGRVRVYY